MENEFVPLTEAKLLKQLGFDELCLAKYQKLSEAVNYQFQLLQKERNCNRLDTAISAPLYHQVFRWFRDNYGLQCYPVLDIKDTYWCLFSDGKNSGYLFIDGDYGYFSEEHLEFKTYEEAELKCLKKLIELCKKN